MIQNTLTKFSFKKIVKDALYEDLGQNGDITSNSIIDIESEDDFYMSAREDGTISGLFLASLTFEIIDKRLKFSPFIKDGDRVKKGDKIAKIKGTTRSILSGERTALNFLSHLSGIATSTNKMVELINKTKVKIVSTRKTTPNLRILEKNAVKDGGGVNHRSVSYTHLTLPTKA